MGRACSISTSYASFEAELEGSILQHTGAVDYYLETQAPKWTSSNDEHATQQRLHSLFIGDMNTSFWQAFTHSRGEISMLDDSPCQMRAACPATAHDAFKAIQLLRSSTKSIPRRHPLQGECRLEQYLQHDLQRYIDMREELDDQTSGCDAAVLSVPANHQLHARTSSSSGSFVRFPEQHILDDEDEDAAAAPLAPAAIAAAAAAAAALAAVRDAATASVAASTAHAARVSWDSSCAAAAAAPAGTLLDSASQQPAAAAGSTAALAGEQQQQQGSASHLPFVMEDDAEIAAQKLAARARMAELEGGEASAAAAAANTCAAAASTAALPAGKAPAGKCLAEDAEGSSGWEPGGVHSSRVPQRPRGLTGLVHGQQRSSGGAELYSLAMGLQGKGEAAMFGGAATRLQAVRFFQTMVAGLLLCLALLPALWALQAWTGGGSSAWLSAKLHSAGAYFYVPLASLALLWVFRSTLLLRPPLLHFPNAELEGRYLLWSNSGKLCVDALFQALLLLVGGCLWARLKHTGLAGGEEAASAHARMLLAAVSMMGCGLPGVLLLLLLRSGNYAAWREQLLAGSRVASMLALLAMQLSAPDDAAGALPLSMPFVALAELMGIACMQVRLATFVPCQVLHLLVLLLRSHAQSAPLLIVQLFGGGLCLPCLLLHSMELYSRKAFLANFTSGAGGKQKVV
uniref:Uncharacterized protein n=1 Tax=Tetradesmus obliquus TaxID=3088 RepID=A0A383VHE6_TETOB|eukprot:jgi/Sobl393_1/10311/SZX64927.1